MAGPALDRSRWLELSPLLDELLDLPPAERASRLDALRAEQPAAADELAGWLAELSGLSESAFLQAPALTPPPGLAGLVVGAYTLVREIGSGGMGSVWLARRTDGRYEGEVAIKFLATGLFSAAGAERFAREGSIMARLAHPHIARLLDAGRLENAAGPPQPYLVLEYVPGEPIDAYCKGRALPLGARLKLFLDVLDAVAHAHNRLILHRDLKPSNILVTPAGEVKLLDFGIAKLLDDAQADELTQQAGAAYTAQYAAPEQLQGGEVTTATDVYALGVLLFRLLSGSLPVDAPSGGSLSQWQAVLQQEPPPVSVATLRAGGPDAEKRARELRGDLDTIVARALKKLPAERYANAAALADDLRRYLAHEPISAQPDSWRYRSGKFLRRHRVFVAAGSLAALALAVGTTVALQQAHEARQQQAQAEGLIEFMLSDLPAKLKPVGRLDALDAVGDRALAYYAAQAPGSLDAASLGRRARALHLMGDITEQAGRLDEAARRFAEAAGTTAELLARRPNEVDRVYNHAQSQFWVGLIARRRGLRAEAETAFLSYQALAQRLIELDPNKPEWRAEAAYAGDNLGVLRLDDGRADEALRAFEHSVPIWQGVAAERPAQFVDLANTLGWVSKAHDARHDYAAAVAAQQAKFAALDRVPDAERNREAQYLRAVAHHEIARLQIEQGEPGAALVSAQQALQQFRALVELEPKNLDWQSQLGSVLATLAELQADRPEGRQALAEAQSLMAPLLASPQRKVRWWLVLQGRMVTLQARAPDAGAAAPLQDWLHAVAEYENQKHVLDAEQTQIRAAASLMLGDAWQRAGRTAEATGVWRDAAARLQPAVLRGDLPARALAGRLAWRLGSIQEARARAEELSSSNLRHPEVLALRDELSRPAARGRRPE